MDRQVKQRLVYSMVQFLRSQLEDATSSGLQEEGIESVEVAMQCLETAYGVSQENSELAVSRTLYDIFSEAMKTESPIQPSTAGLTEATKPVSEEDKAEAEDLKNQGNQLMREEKYTQALDSYTKAISKNSSNGVYYCNRAAAHSKLLNHKDAIEDCKRALQVEPQYSKAYGRMGLAYSSLNDHQKAKECYQKALELEPDNESYRGNLGIAEEKLGSQPQAPPNPFAAFGGGGGAGFPLGGLGGMAGMGGPGGPDVGGLFNNPALMNMATQLMSDPNMQNMMSNFMSSMGGAGGAGGAPPNFMNGLGGMGGMGVGGDAPAAAAPPPPPAAAAAVAEPTGDGTAAPGGPAGMEALLTAGRQLAEQMQTQHPDLVDQIRQQMNRNGTPGSGDGQNQQPPPS